MLPDIFETQLRQKYHSAKLDEISRRRKSKEPPQELKRYSSRQAIVHTIHDKHIAMENLELVKRLAEVRYRPAEISKHWGGKESVGGSGGKMRKEKRVSVKLHRNILQERERLTENERLGKSIEVISKRKKKMILPE
jgi:hypothetical protein